MDIDTDIDIDIDMFIRFLEIICFVQNNEEDATQNRGSEVRESRSHYLGRSLGRSSARSLGRSVDRSLPDCVGGGGFSTGTDAWRLPAGGVVAKCKKHKQMFLPDCVCWAGFLFFNTNVGQEEHNQKRWL